MDSVTIVIDRIFFASEPENGMRFGIVKGHDDLGKVHSVLGQFPMSLLARGKTIEAEGEWDRHQKYGLQLKASTIGAPGDKDSARTNRICQIIASGVMDDSFLTVLAQKGMGSEVREVLESDDVGESMAYLWNWCKMSTDTDINSWTEERLLNVDIPATERFVEESGPALNKLASMNLMGSTYKHVASHPSVPLSTFSDEPGRLFHARSEEDWLTIADLIIKESAHRKISSFYAYVCHRIRENEHEERDTFLMLMEEDLSDLLREYNKVFKTALDTEEIWNSIIFDISSTKNCWGLNCILIPEDEEDPEDQQFIILQFDHLTYSELVCWKLHERCKERSLRDLDLEEASAETERVVEGVLRDLQGSLSVEQTEALVGALTSQFTFITGPPGTGKTFITRALVQCLNELGQSYALVTPTGKAAVRMRESTGEPAFTMHSYFGFDWDLRELTPGPDSFPDYVIVDESSMVDVTLMSSLIGQSPARTSFVFLGDVDQLPPVGCGQPFEDWIGHGENVYRLTKIFRQGVGSSIPEEAGRVLKGYEPVGNDTDFQIKTGDPLALCVEFLEFLEQEYGSDLIPGQDWVILSPQYRGAFGIDSMNENMQALLHQGPADFRTNDHSYWVDMPVVCVVNDYESSNSIMNGEVGVCSYVDSQSMVVTYPDIEGTGVLREREYKLGQVQKFLRPAYAMSVHRAQGSQFEAVLATASTSHRRMLNRRIFYTAITRAKKHVWVADDGGLRSAVRNQEDLNSRMSFLSTYLSDPELARYVASSFLAR